MYQQSIVDYESLALTAELWARKSFHALNLSFNHCRTLTLDAKCLTAHVRNAERCARSLLSVVAPGTLPRFQFAMRGFATRQPRHWDHPITLDVPP